MRDVSGELSAMEVETTSAQYKFEEPVEIGQFVCCKYDAGAL